jgi:hypothetical protein
LNEFESQQSRSFLEIVESFLLHEGDHQQCQTTGWRSHRRAHCLDIQSKGNQKCKRKTFQLVNDPVGSFVAQPQRLKRPFVNRMPSCENSKLFQISGISPGELNPRPTDYNTESLSFLTSQEHHKVLKLKYFPFQRVFRFCRFWYVLETFSHTRTRKEDSGELT